MSSICRKHTVASIARYQAFLRLQTGLKRYGADREEGAGSTPAISIYL